MGFLDKLKGKESSAALDSNEQALLVRFDYGSTNLGPLYSLEDKLVKAIQAAGAGEYDGHEIAVDGSDGSLYMYGPDAERLFEVVQPTLEDTDFLKGAQVTMRYGPPGEGVAERHVRLGA